MALYLAEADVALHEEYGVVRPVEPAGEGMSSLAGEGLQACRCAQYVVPQRVAGEDEVFKVIEYQLGGTVFIRLYFVYDDFCLFVYFPLGEGGVEDDVGKQFEGAVEVFGQEGGVNHRFLLVGVGVEVAAHVLHAVQYVPRLALACAFEQHVLHEVCHAVLVLKLVARAGVDGKAAIGHRRGRGNVDDAQAIGQGEAVAGGGGVVVYAHKEVLNGFAAAKLQQNIIAIRGILRIFAGPSP